MRYDTDYWGAYTRHLSADEHPPDKRNTQQIDGNKISPHELGLPQFLRLEEIRYAKRQRVHVVWHPQVAPLVCAG